MSVLEVNECFSLPCQNGGDCEPLEFGYVCKCAAGYSGMQCQVDVDDCASHPCLNSATCHDSVDNFTCSCAPGFTGHQCQMNIDECASSPCANGATCIDRTLGYTCSCSSGWTGNHCQVQVDECASSPCQNGGQCIDQLADFSCRCPAGWTGAMCEEAVDECLSEPCLHGATCEDLVGHFLCHCPAGYSGQQCQTDVNECMSNPCQSGATCLDHVASFSCLCPPGVIGSLCNTTVDPDFTLHFSSAGKMDYVTLEGLALSRNNPYYDHQHQQHAADAGGAAGNWALDAFTLCAWVKTDDHVNYGTPFSYATHDQPNTLTLTDYSGFVLYVNGFKVVTDVTANDGRWHLICVAWTSRDGWWSIWADGTVRDHGVGLASNTTIVSNGTIILGQEQDSLGGGFSHAESYVGWMHGVELWDSVLDTDTINRMQQTCSGAKGNVLTWADFKHGLRGGIRVQESPFCRGCSIPAAVAHGRVTLSASNVNGTIAFYECEPGYELTWPDPWRPCLIHGGWAASPEEPACRRISCGYPGYIINGLVHGQSFSYGDTVTYNCTKGFRLVGSGQSRRTCQGDGSWSGAAPECQPVTCDVPPILFNGSISSFLKSTYFVGERVSFRCNSGFRLEGAQALTCLDQGIWDDVMPVCQPLSCTIPPYVANAIVTDGGAAPIAPEEISAVPGSVLTYACLAGYKLVGKSGSVICDHDGLWVGSIPHCAPIQCGSPPHVPYSTVKVSGGHDADDHRIGTVADYECVTGYENHGPSRLACTEHTVWSRPEAGSAGGNPAAYPLCMSVNCGPVPQLDNGVAYAEDQVYGSTAMIRCYSGYELAGSPWIECLANRTWGAAPDSGAGGLPQCQRITCYDPPEISNGAARANTSASHEYARYACDSGFILSRRNSLYCSEDGAWRGEVPQCLPMDCPVPAQVESGSWTLLTTAAQDPPDAGEPLVFYTGSEILYSCQSGFQMTGSALLTCHGPDDGWLPEAPTCTAASSAACPAVENPSHGTVVVDGFQSGDSATFECDTGFQLDGPDVITCTDDLVWDPDGSSSCVEIMCPEPESPDNGTVIFTSTTFGSKAVFQCDQGFMLNATGPATRTCGTEGTWIGGRAVSCVPRPCTVPEIIEHGYIGFEGSLNTGSSIVYECEEGYQVIGTSERFCLPSGEWTDEEPYCQLIHCPKLADFLENGSVTGANETVYNSVVHFQCSAGYELIGADKVECGSEKTWSGQFPACRPVQCAHPGLVANGVFRLEKKTTTDGPSEQAFHFQDRIVYSCLPGYQITWAGGPPEAVRQCLADRTWSHKTPKCSRITCVELTYPANSVPGTKNRESGTNVTLTCLPGFQVVGNRTTRCQESGKWNATLGKCWPVLCPDPPAVARATLLPIKTRLQYQFKDQVTYSCDPGFRLHGDPALECTASGTWNTSAGTSCQRAQCPDWRNQLVNGNVSVVYQQTPDPDLSRIAISLNFNCDAGFDLVGNPVAYCTSSGQWSHPLPTCVAWPCPPVPVPQSGSIRQNVVSEDAIEAIIECLPGYELSDPDSDTLTCGPKGSWRGTVQCRPVACPLPPPEHIPHSVRMLNDSAANADYYFRQQLHFGCAPGFISTTTSTTTTTGTGTGSQSVLTCSESGQWSGQYANCVPVECAGIDPAPNLNVAMSSRDVGSKIEFSCQHGYEIRGDPHAICQPDGLWSSPVPDCRLVTCPELAGSMDYGVVTQRGRLVYDTVGYSCAPGFHLKGT